MLAAGDNRLVSCTIKHVSHCIHVLEIGHVRLAGCTNEFLVSHYFCVVVMIALFAAQTHYLTHVLVGVAKFC